MNERFLFKLMEILPGFMVWATFLIIIVFSFIQPLWVIYFVILFDLYWLLRITYMMFYVLVSWRRYRQGIATNWQADLDGLKKDYSGYYHLIFLPTYKEPLSVVEKPFEGLMNTKYDKKKFIVVLAGEERDKQHFEEISTQIREKYGDEFYALLTTVHPKDLPDELPGKGSNTHYAAHRAQEFIDQQNIAYDKIIVSNFDIDTVVHEQYFACLMYKYLTHPNPTRASYQPIAVYNNNVWNSNPVIRVVASSTTFWLFTDLARSQRLFTFSSHSMSFQTLVDVGFWDKTIVTEDSRIFLQGLIQYDGNYETVPMYIPVYMDTVDIGHMWRSLVNQYKQMRRWAWGVEHFPWMVKQFWFKSGKGKSVPLRKKLRYLWNQTEGVYSWSTAPIIILIAGWLPLRLASESDRASALFQNTPQLLEVLMRSGMYGLVVIAILYTLMLPPRPKSKKPLHYLMMFVQWILVPITMILFGSLPAVDAQTRLMLGGKFRLGFWVTEKK